MTGKEDQQHNFSISCRKICSWLQFVTGCICSWLQLSSIKQSQHEATQSSHISQTHQLSNPSKPIMATFYEEARDFSAPNQQQNSPLRLPKIPNIPQVPPIEALQTAWQRESPLLSLHPDNRGASLSPSSFDLMADFDNGHHPSWIDQGPRDTVFEDTLSIDLHALGSSQPRFSPVHSAEQEVDIANISVQPSESDQPVFQNHLSLQRQDANTRRQTAYTTSLHEPQTSLNQEPRPERPRLAEKAPRPNQGEHSQHLTPRGRIPTSSESESSAQAIIITSESDSDVQDGEDDDSQRSKASANGLRPIRPPILNYSRRQRYTPPFFKEPYNRCVREEYRKFYFHGHLLAAITAEADDDQGRRRVFAVYANPLKRSEWIHHSSLKPGAYEALTSGNLVETLAPVRSIIPRLNNRRHHPYRPSRR